MKNYSITDLIEKGKLTSAGELLKLQLDVMSYWSSKGKTAESEATGEVRATPDEVKKEKVFELPAKWNTTKDIELHTWQIDCTDRWFKNGCRGIAKVVTGAGKTIFALNIVQKLQNERAPELRVAVVVPTIILMDQWYDTFARHGNLPPESIGRMGGNNKDVFSKDVRIMICVLASAYKLLPPMVKNANIADKLLLIADECHRTGAEKMSAVLELGQQYTLGLSATPEREPEADEFDDENTELETDESLDISDSGKADENNIFLEKLGGIIYELNYDDAIRMGILPPFEIRHYGLPLNPKEYRKYNSLSKEITELRKELQRALSGKRGKQKIGGDKLTGIARILMSKDDALGGTASRYIQAVTGRKQLLYLAESRKNALLQIMRETFRENPESKVILFHERIAEVMKIYEVLALEGYSVAVDHSELSESLRNRDIVHFRNDAARVLVSARSLIEGFDVPSADVGIIVASSSSKLKKIQTIGRILRKHKDAAGNEKTAVIHSFYIKDTVDKSIYEKLDFGRMVGVERNTYYDWTPPSDGEADLGKIPKEGPPATPKPGEEEVDFTKLTPNDLYPGKYEGTEYRLDSAKSNVLNNKSGAPAQGVDIPDLKEKISQVSDSAYFKITKVKKAILFRKEINKEWKTFFAGLAEMSGKRVNPLPENSIDISTLKAGNEYPLPVPNGIEEYVISDKPRDGGLVVHKAKSKIKINAKKTETATDKTKGSDAELLLNTIRDLRRMRLHINRVRILDNNIVVSLSDNKWYFVCKLEKGLEF